MSNCIVCEEKYSKNILFSDEHIIIMLAIEPSVNGHIQIFPKKHYTIFEHIDDKTLTNLINSANKVSMILFEVLKVHGTNIIINNGVPAGQKIPHVSLDIIPRRNDDSLKLDWDLKQASPDSLETMHRIITEGINVKDKVIDVEVKEIPSKKEIIINKTPENSIESKGDDKTRVKENVYDNSSEESISEKKRNFHHHFLDRLP